MIGKSISGHVSMQPRPRFRNIHRSLIYTEKIGTSGRCSFQFSFHHKLCAIVQQSNSLFSRNLSITFRIDQYSDFFFIRAKLANKIVSFSTFSFFFFSNKFTDNNSGIWNELCIEKFIFIGRIQNPIKI